MLQNKDDHAIWCESSNTWCPYGFDYDGTRCIFNSAPTCDQQCSQARQLGGSIYPKIKEDPKLGPVWRQFLNNSRCFRYDESTNRRIEYCALEYDWPLPTFIYEPVDVIY